MKIESKTFKECGLTDEFSHAPAFEEEVHTKSDTLMYYSKSL